MNQNKELSDNEIIEVLSHRHEVREIGKNHIEFWDTEYHVHFRISKRTTIKLLFEKVENHNYDLGFNDGMDKKINEIKDILNIKI